MGPPPTSSLAPTPAHSQDTDNDSGALDLSSGSRDRENMKSRSSVLSHMSAVSHHSSYVSEGAGSSTDILDLTFPDKNALTEVCYVYGDEHKKGSLAYINTRQNSSKTQHYPSLVHHPPASPEPAHEQRRQGAELRGLPHLPAGPVGAV